MRRHRSPKGAQGMRLVCPRCGAQYEIDDTSVPAEGRDVECSACDHVWRATRPDAPFDAAARPALSRPLSESVIEILREEAARELETRAAERQAARAAARLAERGETAGSPLVGLGDLDDPAERVAAAGGVGAGAAGPGTGGSGTGGHGASVSERSADPGFSSVPEPTAARGLPAPATATAYTGAPAEALLADMPDVEADPVGLHPAGQPTTEQGAPSAAQLGPAADATAPAVTSPASVPPTSIPPASSPSA
ncbi:zinc-ribbon domain-containing protein, partial [Paracoccus sphaerophysae]|uniref:zinc-ribbon domain-containing protein n=1 Tax=Paracoccus sphaerophysae TaxID=690417 RepID=UPI001E3C406E